MTRAVLACRRSATRSLREFSAMARRAFAPVLAPTVNSYKRLIRRGAMGYYSWAPVFNSFGTNNRTNSVRIPMGGGRCRKPQCGFLVQSLSRRRARPGRRT